MCLTTSDPEIKVAQEDILVYKELYYQRSGFFSFLFRTKKGWASLQTHHEYVKGELQPPTELRPIKDRYGDSDYRVYQGYHSEALRVTGTNALFVIPKGTKYIEGFNNGARSRPNYVSETIIFKKRLKEK